MGPNTRSAAKAPFLVFLREISMNKKLKNFVAVCLVCAVVAATPLLASCKKEESKPARKALIKTPVIEKDGTLKVGVNLGFAPYAVMQDDTYAGFDVDVANYLSEKLGLYPEFVAMSPDDVSSALNEGKIDVALSVPMDTADINVYGPYAKGGVALYAGDQSNVTMQDVEGLYPVGVQKNSIGYWTLLSGLGTDNINVYKTDKELIADLAAGKIQVAALDSVVASYAIAGGAKIKMVDYLEGEKSLGVAVSKNKTELSSEIERLLKSSQSTSVFDSFARKWLSAGQ